MREIGGDLSWDGPELTVPADSGAEEEEDCEYFCGPVVEPPEGHVDAGEVLQEPDPDPAAAQAKSYWERWRELLGAGTGADRERGSPVSGFFSDLIGHDYSGQRQFRLVADWGTGELTGVRISGDRWGDDLTVPARVFKSGPLHDAEFGALTEEAAQLIPDLAPDGTADMLITAAGMLTSPQQAVQWAVSKLTQAALTAHCQALHPFAPAVGEFIGEAVAALLPAGSDGTQQLLAEEQAVGVTFDVAHGQITPMVCDFAVGKAVKLVAAGGTMPLPEKLHGDILEAIRSYEYGLG